MSGYADGQRVGTVWRGLAGWVAERARSQTSVCARLLLPPSERRGGCRSHDQRESGTPIMPSCKPMPLRCQCAFLHSVPYIGMEPQSKLRSKRLGEEFKATHRAPF
ncbi:uncharacterized [Tachysurus ichikawai]